MILKNSTIRTSDENPKKNGMTPNFNKLESHIKDITKDMANSASADNSSEALPDNVYATDKIVSGSGEIVDTGSSIVKNSAAKTLDKLNQLRKKRKNEARVLPGMKENNHAGPAKDKSQVVSKEKRYVVIEPGNKKKNGKQQFSSLKTKSSSIVTREDLINENGSGKGTPDAFTMGMDSLKRSFGIKQLLGGAKGGAKKIVDILLKLIKKILKLIVFKFGIIFMPILAIAIIGASYYNNVSRATSEMKKTIKRAFGKDDEDFYEYNSNFDQERAEINAQIPALVSYHNDKVQKILDDKTKNYDKADITKSTVDWDEIRETYMDLIIDGEVEKYLDMSKQLKEQLVDLYEKMVVLSSEIKTEKDKSDGRDRDIKVLYVNVEIKNLKAETGR